MKDQSQHNDLPRNSRDGVVMRMSLEWKLPLIIGGLLLAVIVVITGAAYAQMRRTSLEVAGARLMNVTSQLRDLLQQSGAQLRAQAATTAKNPVVARYAATRDTTAREGARAALRYAGATPEMVLAVELRDSAGALILSSPDNAGLDTIGVRDVIAAVTHPDSAALGKYRSVRDSLVYPIAARIPGAQGMYLVQWRKLTSTRRGRDQLNRLIGADASLMLGNADFSEWTDLERRLPAPKLAKAASLAPQAYVRAGTGRRYIISSALISGTPWQVAVDEPADAVFAPVNAFVRNMALVAIVALALSLLAAWSASRRITAPLIEVTRAADAIASGQHADPVHIDRSDELGLLGRAFSAMAEEVQNARRGLERQVGERTRDLHQTMQQLRDAQDSLVRREKLAMLGQLASGVGHELRNPLGVMTNALYYLKMVQTSAPPNVLEYLDILQQQITLSEKIVGDLLDFARLRPAQREAASVDHITQVQIARLGTPAGLEIETSIPKGIPEVLVDQVQIGQIVLNLLTNAMQAMDGSGRITVSAHVSGDQVCYEVTDCGPGIPPENLEKVFEPLFTTKAKGIGLGLAVSRTLARANGGDLTVQSTPGSGATFLLSLCTAKEAA